MVILVSHSHLEEADDLENPQTATKTVFEPTTLVLELMSKLCIFQCLHVFSSNLDIKNIRNIFSKNLLNLNLSKSEEILSSNY